MKPEKRFPTILGIFILIAGVVGGVFLTNSGVDFRSKASGDCRPSAIQIGNITNSSADISFLTSASCLADLTVDNRTIPGKAAPSKIHYFQINYLKEKTQYNFEVISGGTNYPQPSYVFITPSKPTGSIPTSNLAWGRVLDSSGQPVPGAVVFLSIPGASLLSSPVTTDGNWNVSLANSFNDQKTNWFTPGENQDEDIVVLAPDGTTTQASANTSINNPVPDIIIGKNGPLSSSTSTPKTGLIPTTITTSDTVKLNVINPNDGETISTQKPDFFGAAPVNANINIKVESPVVYNGQTSSDSAGNWHWSPPSNLTPGEHTLTVTATNPQTGIVETIQRKFIVLAADNRLSFSSSPSASLVTPSPSVIPTIIPTIIAATPTLTSTPIPTAVRVVKPSTSSAVPVTGNTSPTFVYLILAASLITFSYLLLVKK